MKSVQDRALELLNSHIRSWTARELAKEMRCSYSTARTALKKLHDTGKIHRTMQNPHGEWVYFRKNEIIETRNI